MKSPVDNTKTLIEPTSKKHAWKNFTILGWNKKLDEVSVLGQPRDRRKEQGTSKNSTQESNHKEDIPTIRSEHQSQPEKDAFTALVEPDTDDPKIVKVTLCTDDVGCLCPFAIQVPKDSIKHITPTGRKLSLGGKKLLVVEVHFDEISTLSVKNIFQQLKSNDFRSKSDSEEPLHSAQIWGEVIEHEDDALVVRFDVDGMPEERDFFWDELSAGRGGLPVGTMVIGRTELVKMPPVANKEDQRKTVRGIHEEVQQERKARGIKAGEHKSRIIAPEEQLRANQHWAERMGTAVQTT